jgi:cysteinyl-tRNA synthetase
MARLLGLLTDELGTWAEDADVAPEVAGWIEQLLGDRVAARSAKNWARADEIRDLLVDAGVEVRDGQEPAWVLKPEFDPAKLEALK